MNESLRQIQKYRRVFITVLVVMNLIALGVAALDRSWGALGIAVIYGPLMNGLLGFISLVFTVRLIGENVRSHIVLSIVSPLLAITVDYLIINSLPLHGGC